jgi:outer membrane biosynthesis protein TonB
MKAVKQWWFKPGQENGRPVAVQVTAELVFALR